MLFCVSPSDRAANIYYRAKADVLCVEQEKAISILTHNTKEMVNMLTDMRETLQKESGIQPPGCGRIATEDELTMLRALANTQHVELSILKSLRFPTQSHRHIEIHEAHRNTFKWVFDEGDGETSWGNFVEWLQLGRGLYWINGKAGSGKSTLMKYLFDHQHTRQHLGIWAQGCHLEIAGFFFWNSGTPEQRSQTGLLRSLLYQLLRKNPDLVKAVFPDQWAEEVSITAGKHRSDPVTWPLPVLKSAFERWAAVVPISTRLCIFIDGLDEYEGDHEEMCEFLKKVSESAIVPIKLCLSSRPWVVFDSGLKGVPSLKLQSLTSPDIRAYVTDKFEVHPRMVLLSQAEPEHAAELTSEIVQKASGVFLWVALVVKSLLRGLMNHDHIDTLRLRLNALPSDLNALFVHMLGSVESVYKAQACRTFRMFETMCNHEISLTKSNKYEWQVSALALYLATKATRFQAKIHNCEAIHLQTVPKLDGELDVHLKTRCAGLLEIHYPRAPLSRPPEGYYTSTVTYLHRTVKDFLATDIAQDLFF